MYISLPSYQETFPNMNSPVNKSAIHPGANTTHTPRLNDPYCFVTADKTTGVVLVEPLQPAAESTSPVAIHSRYCRVVGISSPESVFIDKDGSYYTARIDFQTLVLEGSGQYVGKGGLVRRKGVLVGTDTFELYQLSNSEFFNNGK